AASCCARTSRWEAPYRRAASSPQRPCETLGHPAECARRRFEFLRFGGVARGQRQHDMSDIPRTKARSAVRRLVQAGSVVGACGMMLLGAGSAKAQPVPEPSLLGAVAGVDVADVTGMMSSVMCNNRLADFNYKSPRIKTPHPC